MPLYEYSCPSCKSQFEVLVRSSDENEIACPKCGSHEVSKRFSTFAAHGASSASEMAGGHACSSPGCCAPMPGMCGGGFCEN